MKFYVDQFGVSHPAPEFKPDQERIVADDQGNAFRQRKGKRSLTSAYHDVNERLNYLNRSEPDAFDNGTTLAVDDFGVCHAQPSGQPNMLTWAKNAAKAAADVAKDMTKGNNQNWENVQEPKRQKRNPA